MMDAIPFIPRDAQGGPPGGLGNIISSLASAAAAAAQSTSSTTTDSTSETSTTTSQSSSEVSSTSAAATTTTTSAAAQSVTAAANTDITTTLSTSSTPSALVATTDTSGQTSTTGGSTLSTSIAGASTVQPITASSSDGQGSNLASATNSVPLVVSDAHHSGISPGAIAAAVVVPVLFALFALFLAFLCLRRRARNDHGRTGSTLAFLGAAREKSDWKDGSVLPLNGNSISNADEAVATDRIHAYLNGLDAAADGRTWAERQGSYAVAARGLEESSLEVPPPYKANGLGVTGATDAADAPTMPPLGPLAAPLVSRYSSAWNRNPDEETPAVESAAQRSPFADPESPHTPLTPAFDPDGFLLPSTNERPGTNQSNRRSFTSTLYSDAASIHDAQAAQVSTAPAARMSTATLVESVAPQPLSVQPRHVDTGLSQIEGPFRDPSPAVSSMHTPSSSLSGPGSSRAGSFQSGVSALPTQ